MRGEEGVPIVPVVMRRVIEKIVVRLRTQSLERRDPKNSDAMEGQSLLK